MSDFVTLSRMPGSDAAPASDSFEPGEIVGMRSAAWILLGSALLAVLLVMFEPSGAIGAGVDAFLAYKLFRLRHTWRAWAMFRAWLGLAAALLLVLTRMMGRGSLLDIPLALATAAYAGSLLLLLFGVPDRRRVVLGWVLFAASVLFMFAGILLGAVAQVWSHAAQAQQRELMTPVVEDTAWPLLQSPNGPPAAVKADCQELVETLLPVIRERLEKKHHFYPLGVAMTAGGRISAVTGWIRDDAPRSSDIVAQLETAFRRSAEDGTYRATALALDGRARVHGRTDEQTAIVLRLDHRDSYSVQMLFPYSFASSGALSMDPPVIVGSEGRIFGNAAQSTR